MGRGKWACAAAKVAAAGLVCCVCVLARPVRAADPEDATAILFSGRDLWRNGAFAYGGLLLAPGGFEDDGLLLKILLSGGVYRYRAGDLGGDSVIGAEGAARFMPGWRIKRHGVEAKFFFGLDYERHKLWPDDPGNRLRGADLGLRMALELWIEPSAQTMLAGNVSFSSIDTGWSGRLAGGWRVLDDLFEDGFFVGPEIQMFGSDGYRQLRFGLHVTGLKAESYEWCAAAGWARDSDGVGSPYLRLDMLHRQ